MFYTASHIRLVGTEKTKEDEEVNKEIAKLHTKLNSTIIIHEALNNC